MKRYNIEEFGARADGSLCTEAIQQAINACGETGGIVEIGAGTYLTGTLQLRSHVTLHLAQNAVLLGSEAWPIIRVLIIYRTNGERYSLYSMQKTVKTL